jgi:hydrogenase-4 component E
MEQTSEILLILAAILGLALLGTPLVSWCIRLVALQGFVIAGLVLVVHSDELTARLVALAVASAVLKGFIFPILLFRSLREAGVQREVEPFVGFTLSLSLGVVATGVAFSLADAPRPFLTPGPIL